MTSYRPPITVRKAAATGLALRREYGRGGTMIGVARARDLSNGRAVSTQTLKRMKAFFDRHQVDKKGKGYNRGQPGYPSAGKVANLLWGGEPGYRWAKSLLRKEGP